MKKTQKLSANKKRGLKIFLFVVLVLGAIKVYADQVGAPTHDESQINAYYGLKSYNQFESFMKQTKNEQGEDEAEIENIGSVAFHWGEIKADSLGTSLELKSTMPLGYDKPLEEAKGAGAKTLLSVYMASGYDVLFGMKTADEQAQWFLSTVDETFYTKANFDGLVVDFESLPSKYQENYLQFIEAVSAKVKQKNQILWVAVQPTTVQDYNRLLKWVDQAILMFHDYESKKLSVKRVSPKILTPLVPISKLDKDLQMVTSQLKDKKLKDKLRLQINMATAQWKVKNGVLLNTDKSGNFAYPYRPEYDTVIEKWKQLTKDKKTVESGYMDYDESPYLYYYDESDKTYNTIVYENEKSVKAKMDLGVKYGITRFSVWRLGNIPKEERLGLDMEKILLHYEVKK